MKKTVKTSVVGMMMAAALVAPVHAADSTNTTETMDVKYTEESTYVMSIPKNVEVATDTDFYVKVGVSTVNVAPNEQVQIKVSSGITKDAAGMRNYVELTRDGDNEKIKSIIFQINKTVSGVESSIPVKNGDILAMFEGDSTEPVSLSSGATLIGKLRLCSVKSSNRDVLIKAGKYTGTITFEGNIVQKMITK